MSKFQKGWNVLTTLVVALFLLLAVLLAGARLVGLSAYSVLSGSMEPAYRVGSLIYVRPVDPAKIKVGDVITFVVNEDLLVATHRVVDIEVVTTREETLLDETTGEALIDGETGEPRTKTVALDEPVYYFHTKGDANDVEDGTPVYDKNLIGEPVFTVPLLGYFSSWIQTKRGMIQGGSIAAVLILLMFVPELLKKADAADRRALRKKQANPERDS
jgi:signal peptidase